MVLLHYFDFVMRKKARFYEVIISVYLLLRFNSLLNLSQANKGISELFN